MFLGISLPRRRSAAPCRASSETVLSQIGRAVFGAGADLLRPAALDDGHPRPGRPDELRRLPAPRLVPRARRLHAAPVRATAASASRSTPGSWPWRSLVDRRRRRLRRAGRGADPALRHRRLHVVHPVAGRHGPPLARASAARAGGAARSSTGSAPPPPPSWRSSSRSPSSPSGPGSIIVIVPVLVAIMLLIRRAVRSARDASLIVRPEVGHRAATPRPAGRRARRRT